MRKLQYGRHHQYMQGYVGVIPNVDEKSGIANLVSIPQMERDWFRVTCDTLDDWVIYSPRREWIVCNRDTSMMENMPYISMYELFKDDIPPGAMALSWPRTYKGI